MGAQEAGVTIVDGYVPKEVHLNRATFNHRKIKSELTITADKIILAVGQKANAEGLDIDLQHNEIPFREPRFRTKDPKVFATGDIIAGDKTVVVAVQKGKGVAEEINRLLGGQEND